MITVTDLFAGAGGSSTGAIQVPGVEVVLAANHWQKAIEVHNANHPDTLHVCADLSQMNPRYVPTTDVLWASPECTNHSIAKGRRDARQPKVEWDEFLAVIWAKEAGRAEEFVRVKESLDKNALKKAAELAEDGVVVIDGEIIPGAHWVEQDDSVSFAVNEEAAANG